MDSYETLRVHRNAISRETSNRFPKHLAALAQAVNLLIDATEVIQRSEQRADHHTPEGASKFAVWRFLSAIPSAASLCIEAASAGDYFEAKTLLRLILEEAVKLAYYAEHPDDALRQVERSRDKDDIGLSLVVAQVAKDRGSGLMRLHGYLSAYYSHANVNIPPELIYLDDPQHPQIGGGPRFAPDLFEPIAQQLLLLVANALHAATKRFPSLDEDPRWSASFGSFTMSAASLMPDKATYAAPNDDSDDSAAFQVTSPD